MCSSCSPEQQEEAPAAAPVPVATPAYWQQQEVPEVASSGGPPPQQPPPPPPQQEQRPVISLVSMPRGRPGLVALARPKELPRCPLPASDQTMVVTAGPRRFSAGRGHARRGARVGGYWGGCGRPALSPPPPGRPRAAGQAAAARLQQARPALWATHGSGVAALGFVVLERVRRHPRRPGREVAGPIPKSHQWTSQRFSSRAPQDRECPG